MYVHAVLVADFIKLMFHIERRILIKYEFCMLYFDVTSVFPIPLITLCTVCATLFDI